MSESTNEKLFDLDLLPIADVSDSLFSDSQDIETVGEKHIVFTINDIHYAIVSKAIAEVVRPLSYTPLPNLPDWFLGIANLRGDIVSIIDPQTLWGLEAHDPPKSKLIILRSKTAESQIAFKVDKLREIVTLPEGDIHESPEKATHLAGKITLKSTEINIIDIDSILSSLALN